MDATGFGYPLGQIPRMDVLSFEADKKLIELADKSVQEGTARDRNTYRKSCKWRSVYIR